MRLPIAPLSAALASLLLAAPAAARPLVDYPGHADPPLLPRLPRYFLDHAASIERRQVDGQQFLVQGEERQERERVDGRFTQYRYRFDPSAGTPAAPFAILRAYQAAARQAGGQVLFDDTAAATGEGRTTLRLIREGLELWIEVAPEAQGAVYYVRIVERPVVRPDPGGEAQALFDELARAGHVALVGLEFEANASALRPGAAQDAALRPVLRLLQEHPSLRLRVVGHSDDAGEPEAGVALSQERAVAVARALAAGGADPARLVARGVGPYAPIASNATEEGRARNRRVELVLGR